MAYGLRYYKELTHPDGKVVRLEILEKGGTIAAKEIGPVCQALRLDIQGDTEIDAPIVKTSLTMTFVDAPDHPEAKAKKCGNWAEFYTSDSTLWQVKVKVKNAKETAFSTIWTGYITPDSFTEVLQYRGSVTIVARDNIGHLNDFPFDAEGNTDGMISLRELVQAAWAKIENPMEVIYYSDDWMLSEGVNALNTMMNVSAFEDMNWYDALESALFGYGAALRWIGGNEVIVRPLRMLPYMGRSIQQTIITQDPIFMSGAERELTPAVRRIEESVSYELEERFAVPLAKSVSFTGATATIPYNSRTLLDGTKVVNIPTWPIANKTNEGWGNGDKTLFLNPKAYSTTALASELGDSLVLATNTDGSGRVWYGRYMQGKNFTLSVSFGQMIERSNSSLVTIMFNPVTVKKVVASISATANGITKYLNAGGVWQTSEEFMDFEIDAETRSISKNIPVGTFSTSESLVKFTIKDITLGGLDGNDWWDVSDGGGIYVELNSLTYADNSGVALCETNRVNTNYNTENNIILSRDPKIAPALNDVLFPSFIKNGIFVQDGNTYNPAKTWSWEGQTPQQMAVYNHLQLLCYHAKPNNILRGTIVNADNTNLQTLWMWQGAEHMLVSGSLNFLNGYIENAVLREFARYEEMWGMLAPADFPEVEGKSRTTAEGGASTASEGARTTSTTTVNIGGSGGSMTIDTFMSDTSTNAVGNRYIKAYVDDLGNDITEAYNAAISALNTEITNALKGKVDNDTFNTLSAQVVTNKTDIGKLDTRLTTAEGEIDTLQTYTTWLDSVKGLIYKDGDNIKINTSLIVSGDTSSEGSGSDTPALGTVTSIKVNNTPYNPNSAGVIDLSEAFNSIDVSSQLANYALTDYVNTQFALVNSALSGKQDALGYTPLSTGGGTLYNGVSDTPLYIKSDRGAAYIGFKNSSDAFLGYYGFNDITPTVYIGTSAEYSIIHSGNIGSQSVDKANKLATARTIWGQSFDGTSGVDGYMFMSGLDVLHLDASSLWLNYGAADGGKSLRLCGNDVAIYYGKSSNFARAITINSSGNVTIGASDIALSYCKLFVNGELDAVRTRTQELRLGDTLEGSNITQNKWYYASIGYEYEDVLPNTRKPAIVFKTMYNTYAEGTGVERMRITSIGNILIGTTKDYGFRFACDALSDSKALGYLGTGGGVMFGNINEGYGTAIWTQGNGNGYIQQGRSNQNTSVYNLILQPLGGNVGIGNTDPQYKLDVNGEVNAMSALRIGGCGTSYCGLYPNSQITSGGSSSRLWLYNESGIVIYASALEILTSTSITGNLVVSGDTSSGSDIRFKDIIEHKTLKIEDIANAPLFTFTWNNREDKTPHFGTSAQYWENVCSELVSGSDFKTLNYASLGVGMGISLAKKVVNHEERIKMLELEIKRLKEEQYGC